MLTLAKHSPRRAGRAGAIGALLLLCCLRARADELHLTNGKVVHGLLEKQTRTGYVFKEVDAKRPKTWRRKEVQTLVLTFDLPDFVYNDPRWSEHMVGQRVEATFREEWGEVEVLRSDHYIVFTNSSAGDRYSGTMEDIYDKFIKEFPFEAPEDAVLMPVFLFKTKDQYDQFYADIAGISVAEAARSGGHAWRDYYATYYQAPRDPVHYHEGAHQLVHNRLRIRGGGSWFQEGMAVYFEGTIFAGEDPAKGMKGMVRSERHLPLPEFFKLPSLLYSSGTDQEADLAHRRYQQAGAVIKFFREGQYAEHFDEMLAQVKAGRSWDSIFGQLFRTNADELEQQFVEYYSK